MAVLVAMFADCTRQMRLGLGLGGLESLESMKSMGGNELSLCDFPMSK